MIGLADLTSGNKVYGDSNMFIYQFEKFEGFSERAALVGASVGLKLLDAIHYVSARDAGCTHFLTADKVFKSSAGLHLIQL
jgi:predicted nucleic acid-binding protein